jgi:HD-GYP domain-containing protein (c-di-GMP phosphodiesterase class II)
MSTFSTPHPKTLKVKFILSMGLVVTLFVSAIFYWIFQHSKEGVISQLDLQARALLQQIIITRAWIADHGGLFVAQGLGVEANPFLPDTDIKDQQGRTYHFRNPAMITREISEYANTVGLYRFRLTSLKLKNPGNKPLSFEKESLIYFQEKGYGSTKTGLATQGDDDKGARVYRRIIPLRVEESCLECHADQGYSVGDIRGGLSVFIPMSDALKTIKLYGFILILSGIGIIGIVSGVIYILLRKMVLQPVNHLHHVAQRLVDGEYNVRACLSTGDEFEAFAHAFNKMNDRLKNGYEGTIKALVAAIDARDPYTKGHTARVARYSVAIAKEMGLQEEILAEVELGAILHDIGKIGITDEILSKSTPLVGEEILQMATHPQKGAVIIDDADFLRCAIPAILYHHERPDGKGYPDALKGNDIPLAARIIAVADAFDAMTTNRPYNKALKVKEAVREIEKQAGKQFDTEVARAFQTVMEKELS